MTASEHRPSSSRLEAFSDGVFAIILTIMVLELHPPHGGTLNDLLPLAPVVLSYILSFVYLMIYWNNHHHLLRTLSEPKAATMWANAHLLFWLSLIPFTTAWVGQSYDKVMPAVVYGCVLLAAACAYFLLQRAIIVAEGTGSVLARALGNDYKGKLSPVLYTLGIGAAFIRPWISYLLFVAVALMWCMPDRRIEIECEKETSDV